MKVYLFSFIFAILFISTACNKKHKAELVLKNEQIEQLKAQVDNLQNTNEGLLDRMTDLSIVNKTGAESIKKSLESINQQYNYIEDLTEKIQIKDSINLALVTNLKRSLTDIHDEDVQVEVRGGVVYISISDKMLFRSGSSSLGPEAQKVLSKISQVINDHDEIDILVEGHTDNIPIANECNLDNWDLSVKRATSVIRSLQNDFYVDPKRLTAGGRSEYMPKANNEFAAGREQNRRTEIIITPRIDQYFKLLEPPDVLN